MMVVINRLKDPPTWLNETTTLDIPPIHTHLHLFVIANGKDKHFCYAIAYEKFQHKWFFCILNCFILHTIPCITKLSNKEKDNELLAQHDNYTEKLLLSVSQDNAMWFH